MENQKDYADDGKDQMSGLKEETQKKSITREEIENLKLSMENVFGKNWSPSDVQEAFDQRGDYDDGDLVDSDLFVSIEGNERLIPMGNIKVKYVDILFKSSMLKNNFRKNDFGDYQGGNLSEI